MGIEDQFFIDYTEYLKGLPIISLTLKQASEDSYMQSKTFIIDTTNDLISIKTIAKYMEKGISTKHFIGSEQILKKNCKTQETGYLFIQSMYRHEPIIEKVEIQDSLTIRIVPDAFNRICRGLREYGTLPIAIRNKKPKPEKKLLPQSFAKMPVTKVKSIVCENENKTLDLTLSEYIVQDGGFKHMNVQDIINSRKKELFLKDITARPIMCDRYNLQEKEATVEDIQKGSILEKKHSDKRCEMKKVQKVLDNAKILSDKVKKFNKKGINMNGSTSLKVKDFLKLGKYCKRDINIEKKTLPKFHNETNNHEEKSEKIKELDQADKAIDFPDQTVNLFFSKAQEYPNERKNESSKENEILKIKIEEYETFIAELETKTNIQSKKVTLQETRISIIEEDKPKEIKELNQANKIIDFPDKIVNLFFSKAVEYLNEKKNELCKENKAQKKKAEEYEKVIAELVIKDINQNK